MEIPRLTSSRALPITFIPRDFAVRLTREIYRVCLAAASSLESDFPRRGDKRKRSKERGTSTGSPSDEQSKTSDLSKSRFRELVISPGPLQAECNFWRECFSVTTSRRVLEEELAITFALYGNKSTPFRWRRHVISMLSLLNLE